MMTQAQPPAIERIPDEILHEIFVLVATGPPEYDEHSFPVSGPHPLLPVVQVNRRFSAVASPLLVRNWHLRLSDESGVKFVLNLLKQPQLCSQIKSLAVDERKLRTLARSRRARLADDDDGPRAPGLRWPRSFCSTAELEQLAQSAKETCPMLACWAIDEEECSWAGQIRQRCPHATAALALAWATGLQELDLLADVWTDPEPCPWIIRLVKMAVKVLSPMEAEDRGLLVPPPDVFTKLRRVSLGHYGSNGPPLAGTIAAAFFRLPSLRVFQALAVEVAGLALDEADPSGSRIALQPLADKLFPNGTSGVEELHLYQCSVTDNGLSVLTRSCRSLRVLIFQWEWNDSFELSNESIAAAIRLHSVSLEKIVITGYHLPDDIYKSDPGSLGDCLLFCNKLTSLVINLVVLYGRQFYDNNSSFQPLSEVLPPGLNDLGLCFPPSLAGGQATKDNILGLLSQCGPKERFSKLKKIDFIGCSTGYMEDQEIIALAKKVGVELTQHDGPGGMV